MAQAVGPAAQLVMEEWCHPTFCLHDRMVDATPQRVVNESQVVRFLQETELTSNGKRYEPLIQRMQERALDPGVTVNILEGQGEGGTIAAFDFDFMHSSNPGPEQSWINAWSSGNFPSKKRSTESHKRTTEGLFDKVQGNAGNTFHFRKRLDSATPWLVQAAADFDPPGLTDAAYKGLAGTCPHLFQMLFRIPSYNHFVRESLNVLLIDAIVTNHHISMPAGDDQEPPWEEVEVMARGVALAYEGPPGHPVDIGGDMNTWRLLGNLPTFGEVQAELPPLPLPAVCCAGLPWNLDPPSCVDYRPVSDPHIDSIFASDWITQTTRFDRNSLSLSAIRSKQKRNQDVEEEEGIDESPLVHLNDLFSRQEVPETNSSCCTATHFGNGLFVVHNESFHLFEEGGFPSCGLEAMATGGDVDRLAKEVARSPGVFSIQTWGGLFQPGNCALLSSCEELVSPAPDPDLRDCRRQLLDLPQQASTRFSRVSFVAHVGGTTDWFIGVDSVDLLDDQGQYKSEVMIPFDYETNLWQINFCRICGDGFLCNLDPPLADVDFECEPHTYNPLCFGQDVVCPGDCRSQCTGSMKRRTAEERHLDPEGCDDCRGCCRQIVKVSSHRTMAPPEMVSPHFEAGLLLRPTVETRFPVLLGQ